MIQKRRPQGSLDERDGESQTIHTGTRQESLDLRMIILSPFRMWQVFLASRLISRLPYSSWRTQMFSLGCPASPPRGRGADNAPLAQEADPERHPELDLPHYAIAARVATTTSRAGTDAEPVQDARVPPLQRFRVSDARVRHVDVDSRLADPLGTCAGSSGDRLVLVSTPDSLASNSYSLA